MVMLIVNEPRGGTTRRHTCLIRHTGTTATLPVLPAPYDSWNPTTGDSMGHNGYSGADLVRATGGFPAAIAVMSSQIFATVNGSISGGTDPVRNGFTGAHTLSTAPLGVN